MSRTSPLPGIQGRQSVSLGNIPRPLESISQYRTRKQQRDPTMRTDELLSTTVNSEQFVPVEDVVQMMRTVVQQRNTEIDQHKKKLGELQGLVRQDHETLQTLDQSIAERSKVTSEVEQMNVQLQTKFEELRGKLAQLDEHRSQVLDEIKATKEKEKMLNEGCVSLEESISSAQAAQREAEETVSRLNDTVVGLMCDVRSLQTDGEALTAFRRSHNRSDLERQIDQERRRFEDMNSDQTKHNSQLKEKEEEIRKLKQENLERHYRIEDAESKHKSLTKKKERRERTLGHKQQIKAEIGHVKARLTERNREISSQKRQVESERREQKSMNRHGRQSKNEIEQLKKSIANISGQLVTEKERMVAAQAKLHAVQRTQRNSCDVTRVETETRKCEDSYRKLKRTKREMEAQMRYLANLSCDLKDDMDTTEYIADRLRRELRRAKRTPVRLQPVIIKQPPTGFECIAPRIESQLTAVQANRVDLASMKKEQGDVGERMESFAGNLEGLKSERDELFDRGDNDM